jgi:ubiquinone/menaquinone biosynthesis C-methylase UbiE
MDIQTNELQSDPRYDTVKKYYDKVLQNTTDLKTDACCTSETLGPRVTKALLLINDEIKDRYYGCGSPIPLCVEGLKILDLGCGTGRDCYVMSKLVGQDGFVHGIDMTENQITVAKKYIDEQTVAFGYTRPNVKFVFDYIENLQKHFEKESLDVVTSNCVINLTEDKEVILRQVYETLKFGGEMYFSDIYADRRVPEEISKDPILRGECLGGALYYKDFERIARKVGFTDPRIFSQRFVKICNEEIENMVENIKFYSITYRLWKLNGLEDACEDYGHMAVYTGQIPESPYKFELDKGHVFCRNKPERICGNTALMLSQTRFKKHFQVIGSFKEHFGAFKGCSNVDTTNLMQQV